MRALLLLNLASVRGKYWLIPAIMALAAVALSFGMVALDAHLGTKWAEQVPWLYANGPTGARALLSTIAGSMITVAGVTFSITTVAIATTASTFGPRLIGNFMRDRGNQITLGTFIATFLFCILVLRTVQSADEGAESFVPHLALAVALLLAMASLGVLIYFMHHVPESLHISNVVAGLGRDLRDQVEELFPDPLGEAEGQPEADADALAARPGIEIEAGADGYLRYIDVDDLVRQAERRDMFVVFRRRAGDFVAARDVVATLHAHAPPDDEARDAIRSAWVVGTYRSREQDVIYGVDRLVEVAARALSPGMNDVFTAKNAIDWLGGALAHLVRRHVAGGIRRDEAGRPRVALRAWSFEEIAGAVFDQLRAYVSGDRNAALHLMGMLAHVARHAEDRDRRALLLRQAKALRDRSREMLSDPSARDALEVAYEDAAAVLGAPKPEAHRG